MSRIARVIVTSFPNHLIQRGKFVSFPVDGRYLLATVRSIEMNRVASKLVQCPENAQWSSAQAHLKRENDQKVKVAPLLQLIPHWAGFMILLKHPVFRK